MTQNTLTDTAVVLAASASAETSAPVASSEATVVTAEKSAPVARFVFEGFNILENNDTATHLVDVGTIVDDEKTFKVIMLRARNLPPQVGFIVSKIETEGKKIWDYMLDDEKNICVLAKVANQAMVVHLEKGPQGKILRVVPVSQIGKHVTGTPVVIVKSFDDATGEYGEVVEAFKVGRERGKNPFKDNPAPVSVTKPTVKQIEEAKPPLPVGQGIAEKGGAFVEVQVYPTREVIDRAVAKGLNGGTYVTAMNKVKDGKAPVFVAQGGKLKSVGNLAFQMV